MGIYRIRNVVRVAGIAAVGVASDSATKENKTRSQAYHNTDSWSITLDLLLVAFVLYFPA